MAVALILGIEWTNVHLAGAFLIGWLFGTIVTLRLLRVVMTAIRRDIPSDGDQD